MATITIEISEQHNATRAFDNVVAEKLKHYVYALKDPRDGKIFYVGKGQGNRVFQHFDEADECMKKGKSSSSKILRILDIWKNQQDVEYVIIAHGLEKKVAFAIEAAVIDSLGESQNGQPLNEIKGQHSSLLTEETLKQLAIESVNPSNQYETVFVFPIQNALKNSGDVYESTRKWWKVSDKNSDVKNAIAVGLDCGVCKGVYSVKNWVYNEEFDKSQFNGTEIADSELLNTKWQNIISVTKGYWQRGNYLIVSFDGKGNFSVTRGAGDNNGNWIDCK